MKFKRGDAVSSTVDFPGSITRGKKYIILDADPRIMKYLLTPDSGIARWFPDYDVEAVMVLTSPIQQPAGPGNWMMQEFEHMNQILLDKIAEYKPKCCCGSAKLGHPGHSDWCDVITGRRSA